LVDAIAAAPLESSPRGRWWSALYTQIIVALVLGVLVGWLFPALGASLKPLGDGFIKLVKLIIAPVIFCTVVTGIAGMTSLERLGRVGAKALAYFLFFSTLALVVGMIVGNIVRPGALIAVDPGALDPAAVAEYQHRASDSSVTAFILDIIPETLVGAFVGGQILQVLLVSVLVGFALVQMGAAGSRILAGLSEVSRLLFRIVEIIMRFAPIGVFGAMAFTIGNYGFSSLVALGGLIATFYLTSIVFIFVVLGVVSRCAGFSIWRLLRYLRAELVLVLGTSSSEVALPRLMDKLQRAGANRSIVGLVVPTGYSFNLDGTNIYMTLAALFIAQATGIDLSLEEQALLLGVAMISSKGAAGVTGAGFVTLAATLSVVPSIPVAGMALILGIDRFMSECRALTNFIGNAVATLAIARWEKALDDKELEHALRDL
jgi:aerobic C4-dicarboxylate transport protein